MRPIKVIAFLMLAAALMAACSDAGSDEEERADEPAPVRTLVRPTTGPYVSVAVDNHFHDIHPEDGVTIAADRPFIVKNQGRNLHNFHVGGTDVDVDIRPGREFALDPLSELLDPGEYTVICKYHQSMGMVGAFEVVAPGS